MVCTQVFKQYLNMSYDLSTYTVVWVKQENILLSSFFSLLPGRFTSVAIRKQYRRTTPH